MFEELQKETQMHSVRITTKIAKLCLYAIHVAIASVPVIVLFFTSYPLVVKHSDYAKSQQATCPLCQNRTHIRGTTKPLNFTLRGDNIIKLTPFLPPDGFPRAVITRSCSGSSATLRYTRQILEAHGYSVARMGEPMRQQRETIMTKAKERLEAKLDHEPTLQELLAESFVFLNERAIKDQKILLVKTGEFNSYNEKVLETLEDLGTKFTYTYRSNYLDRAICAIRDCFLPELGNQIYTNGTIGGLCFGRREHSDVKVMAYVKDAEALIKQMQNWEMEDRERESNYTNLYYPAEVRPFEDLFKFEYTDSEKDLNDSVEAWCGFLKNFGQIKIPIVEEILRASQNSKPPRPPLEELIYNFDEIEGSINESRFREYLSK